MADAFTEHGQSPGTAAPETVEQQGRRARPQDRQSAVPAWPRLLSREQAAAYLGLSPWSFDEQVNAGRIQAVRVPRPDTARQRKRRHVNAESLRRKLFDRLELDALVERWRAGG